MMVKVVSIDRIEPFEITCTLNNGSKRKIDVRPLIEAHKHLKGISDLLKLPRFLEAEVGELGEIRWRKTIRIASGEDELWDYDISPEFIFHQGIKVD
jgi:hypothetical protein